MATKKVSVQAKMESSWQVALKGGNHQWLIDQPTMMGGEDSGPNPLEVFFSGLAGCICTVAKIVAKQQNISYHSIEVLVEGELNPDVLMGKNKEERSGFKEIILSVKIDAPLSLEQKEAFLHEVDRRCPVSNNILEATPIALKIIS